ncbi:MAG: hypothetical protein CMM99_05715 [Rickettsiales bacterium]|nr:hypothetical protein [Rickettsiales bacterium]
MKLPTERTHLTKKDFKMPGIFGTLNIINAFVSSMSLKNYQYHIAYIGLAVVHFFRQKHSIGYLN